MIPHVDKIRDAQDSAADYGQGEDYTASEMVDLGTLKAELIGKYSSDSYYVAQALSVAVEELMNGSEEEFESFVNDYNGKYMARIGSKIHELMAKDITLEAEKGAVEAFHKHSGERT